MSFGHRSTQDERNHPRDCTKRCCQIKTEGWLAEGWLQRAGCRGLVTKGWRAEGWLQRAGCRELAAEGWLQRAGYRGLAPEGWLHRAGWQRVSWQEGELAKDRRDDL